MTTKVLIIPGIGNSSPTHWQSLWEAGEPHDFSRISLSEQDWERPLLDSWIMAIERAMTVIGADTVLAAHSLGCLAVAHWAAFSSLKPLGALLVSPPDPKAPAFPKEAQGFSPIPQHPLGFETIVVASSNDSYVTLEHARCCARAWGSRLLEVGPAGHLGDSDGLGAWPAGRALLDGLRTCG